MDNGTEFNNDLFNQVAEQMGVERKIYTPPYRSQSNGHIEGFHNFLKSCLSKYVKKTDMVTKLICQLPNYDAFGRLGRLSFDPEWVQDLGWTMNDQDFKFNPDHVSDPPAKKHRSHPMQLQNASDNDITSIDLNFSALNIGQLLQNNSVLTWVNN